MKKIYLLTMLICLLGVSQKNFSQTVLTGNIGKNYKITKPGVYQIQGTVTGNITVEPNTNGDIIVEGIGNNPILHGIPWGGNTRRHVSHFSGGAKGGSLTWRNMTIVGDGHNAMEGSGTTTLKIYENLHVKNYERVENGRSYDNVGSINGGPNSIIRDCYIETGDDAAKLTEKNSRCFDTRIRLTKNGCAIQFGWQDRFGDPDHIADNVEIRGKLEPNIKDQTNESNNPGRCIIGGIVQNNVENVQLTNLDIDVTKYKHLIKFMAQDGGTQNPVLKDVYIQGVCTDRSVMNVENMFAIALTAKQGAKIRNMVIDLGDKVANTQYHYISGDVDVQFIKSDGSIVEYIGGVLQQNSNNSPVANAGPNQTVTDTDANGIETIILDGSGSSDSDGTITSYVWTESGVEIATGVSPTVDLGVGTHNITLTVTDNDGAKDTDAVTVTVTESGCSGFTNITDLSATVVDCAVELAWSDIPCATSYIVRRKQPGDAVYGNLGNVGGNVNSFTDNTVIEGQTYIYQVRPFDGTTKLVSNNPQLTVECSTPNVAPIANAGSDQTVNDADDSGAETVSLDGSGSSDSDGTIASYVWTLGGTEIANGASPSVSLPVGVNTVTLTVTDDDGASDSDDVVVEVTEYVNIAPLANAGADQVVNDADDSGDELISLDGSGSADSDGSIVAYSWAIGGTEIATGVLSSVSLAVGVHTVVLTVTDDDGAIATDNVVIEVTEYVNKAPVADAGVDQTVEDSDNSGSEIVCLDASNSIDTDGTIVSYVWTIGGTQIASGIAPCVELAIGTYTITLTITDDDGAAATDNLSVTVEEVVTGYITITDVKTDCNTKGKARNVVSFTVSGTTQTPTINKGTLLNDGGGNYRIRHIGVAFGSITNYNISVAGETVSESVTAVSSCPKSTETIANSGLNLEIYPNPADEYINVAINTNSAKLEILSITGQLVYTEILNSSYTPVNISQLQRGIYFIVVKSENQIIRREVVVE